MIALAADDRRLADSTSERVRELADRHPSTLAELARLWCDGLVTGRADLLEDAADLADHSRSPVTAARARADAARACADDRAASEDLVGLGAAGWARWHLGVTSPPQSWRSPVSGWESLTLSERRVVELVGLGHTNADIADALSISRRTVESHLYRSYPKLGMSSRVELALFVHRRRGD